ncbi:Beta-lactamase hydrolase-like protein phosphatase-like domain-containing protein [Novosphingobium lubricantis]
MTDPDDIRAWQRLDDRTTTSGRIVADDVARLAGLGVRHVINLALDTHPEALADEAARLARHGIAYTHIPVPFDAPDDDHFAAFVTALEEGPAPVHVHCILNWRVSAFFCRYNRERRGLGADAARAIMARQWNPETAADVPQAPAWAAFIAGGA